MNQNQNSIDRITKLSSAEVLNEVLSLSQRERDLTVEILHYLRVIEGRRLYAEWGFSSLFEFASKKMGYSEGAAHRRISALRLIKEVPQTEGLLREGELTLTTASQLQTFFQSEKRKDTPCTTDQKKELIDQVRNQSKRGTEKILSSRAPEGVRPDKERSVNSTQTEIRFVASDELMKKFEEIRNLISQRQPNATYQELMSVMADLALRALRPKEPRTPPYQKIKEPNSTNVTKAILKPRRRGNRKAIPAEVKRQVWSRDQGQCTYQDPVSGQKCGSRYQLEFDHRVPVAKGGDHSIENLRVRCKAHNLWEAIRVFGETKMGRYVECGSQEFV